MRPCLVVPWSPAVPWVLGTLDAQPALDSRPRLSHRHDREVRSVLQRTHYIIFLSQPLSLNKMFSYLGLLTDEMYFIFSKIYSWAYLEQSKCLEDVKSAVKLRKMRNTINRCAPL